jgi:hypothetical protein
MSSGINLRKFFSTKLLKLLGFFFVWWLWIIFFDLFEYSDVPWEPLYHLTEYKESPFRSYRHRSTKSDPRWTWPGTTICVITKASPALSNAPRHKKWHFQQFIFSYFLNSISFFYF